MTLHLIEASSMMYRFFFGYPDMRRASDLHPIQVAHGCVTAFWHLVRERPTHVAFVLDRGKSTARCALYPDYKSQRPPMAEELQRQREFPRRAAEAFGFTIVVQDGVEADDLIATHARLALEAGHEVLISSTDKDMHALIRPGVTMFDARLKKLFTRNDVIAKWGVPPEQMVDFLSLTGDKSDNIPGVLGIGPKKAAALLQTWGALENALDRVHEIKPDSVRVALQKEGHKARFAKKLVQLDEYVPVEHSIADFAYNSSFDTRAVLDFLDEMEDLPTIRKEIADAMAEAA